VAAAATATSSSSSPGRGRRLPGIVAGGDGSKASVAPRQLPLPSLAPSLLPGALTAPQALSMAIGIAAGARTTYVLTHEVVSYRRGPPAPLLHAVWAWGHEGAADVIDGGASAAAAASAGAGGRRASAMPSAPSAGGRVQWWWPVATSPVGRGSGGAARATPASDGRWRAAVDTHYGLRCAHSCTTSLLTISAIDAATAADMAAAGEL